MSRNEKPQTSKNKHYTLIERKVFLQILEKYKNVIEVKRSDSTTLKDKDVTRSEICMEYNESSLICQTRTVQQLKKLWANLKQSQRDALTKEKQPRLSTGGGLQEPEPNIDPDILNIAPHLMETAPVLFSSNMSEKEVKDKHDLTFDIICNNDNINLLDNDDNTMKMIDSQLQEFDMSTKNKIDRAKKECDSDNDISIIDSQDTLRKSTSKQVPPKVPIKKRKHQEVSYQETEDNLRVQRIKQVMSQKQDLATVKLKHEQNMNKMREEHLEHMNEMEALHKKEINKLEREIKITKLKILQSQDYNKKNINLQL